MSATARTLVVERVIEAPPEVVWPYVSSGELWSHWQGERCVLEPVSGSEFRVEMSDGAVASGTVLDVRENERIVMTWGWSDAPFELPPGSTTVEIRLEPHPPARTRLVLTHRDVPDQLVEHHRGGWDRCLSALAEDARASGRA